MAAASQASSAGAISALLSAHLALGYATPAMAAEPPAADDEPTSVDVTIASSFVYNGNNRNQRPNEVVTRLDDDWSLWYNRVNLHGSRGRWSLMLRGDSAWFPTNRGAAAVALELTEERTAVGEGEPFGASDAAFFRSQVVRASQELSTRFVSWVYPAKYAVSYQSPRLELSFGDSYAQLGRGLVLSTRKVDELSGDTSIRGIRVTAKHRDGAWHLRFTGIAGAMNPLRATTPAARTCRLTIASPPACCNSRRRRCLRRAQTPSFPTPRPLTRPIRCWPRSSKPARRRCAWD